MLIAAIEVNVSVFLLAGIAVFFAIIGFLIRGSKSESMKKKIDELEREILESHSEILQLQKEKIDLLKSISEPSIPVISITASKEEKTKEMLPDVANRKKLLGSQPSVKQQQLGG